MKNPTKLDEEIASKLRKATVKIRTSAKAFKDERKRIYTLRGNVEQSAFNLISDTCELAEIEFEKIEKASAIKEKLRIDNLAKERFEKLIPFGFQLTAGVHLGLMEETMFLSLLAGTEKIYFDKIESEKKAELERLESLRLAEEQRKKQQEELESLRIANELKDKAAKEAKEKAGAEIAALKAKAEAEAKKQSEILAKQKAQTKRLEEELALELKAKHEAEIKELQRIEEKRLELENLSKAPDKEKLLKWIDELSMPYVNLTTMPANKLAVELKNKFDGFKSWANKEINKL